MAELTGVDTIHNFDVVGFAKSILSEVERIRAFSQLKDTETAEDFTIPTESRLNAFYRLIGLPMFVTIEEENSKKTSSSKSKGVNVLTPGFDSFEAINYENKIIKNAEEFGNFKIDANLSERENILGFYEKSAGTQIMNDRMTKSLYYPMGLAPNIPEDNGNDYILKEGEISIENKRIVFKKLKPMITSYSDVYPKYNELAKPFLPELIQQKIDNNTVLAKPFIETIIRIRLISLDGANKTSENDKLDDFTKSIKTFLGDQVFNDTFNSGKPEIFSNPNLLEKFVFNKLIASISKLAVKCVELNLRQQYLMKKSFFNVSIKSSSSKNSPFGKRTSIASNVTFDKNAEDGLKMDRLKVSIAKDEVLLSLIPSDDTSGLNKSQSESKTKNTAKSALVDGFIYLLNQDLERNKQQLRSIENKIALTGQKVEKLRLELDMMTGEFTGISVPDIVATIIGLFVIDKRSLINLLDKKTIDYMKKDKSLESALNSFGISSPSTSDTFEAVKQLEIAVTNVFTLLNKQIQAIRERDKKTKKIETKAKDDANEAENANNVDFDDENYGE